MTGALQFNQCKLHLRKGHSPLYLVIHCFGWNGSLPAVQDLVLQSGQGEIQVAQLEGAVKQIAAFAQVRPMSLSRPMPRV